MNGGHVQGCGGRFNPWNYEKTPARSTVVATVVALAAITAVIGIFATLAASGVNLTPLNALGKLSIGGGAGLTGFSLLVGVGGAGWLITKPRARPPAAQDVGQPWGAESPPYSPIYPPPNGPQLTAEDLESNQQLNDALDAALNSQPQGSRRALWPGEGGPVFEDSLGDQDLQIPGTSDEEEAAIQQAIALSLLEAERESPRATFSPQVLRTSPATDTGFRSIADDTQNANRSPSPLQSPSPLTHPPLIALTEAWQPPFSQRKLFERTLTTTIEALLNGQPIAIPYLNIQIEKENVTNPDIIFEILDFARAQLEAFNQEASEQIDIDGFMATYAPVRQEAENWAALQNMLTVQILGEAELNTLDAIQPGERFNSVIKARITLFAHKQRENVERGAEVFASLAERFGIENLPQPAVRVDDGSYSPFEALKLSRTAALPQPQPIPESFPLLEELRAAMPAPSIHIVDNPRAPAKERQYEGQRDNYLDLLKNCIEGVVAGEVSIGQTMTRGAIQLDGIPATHPNQIEMAKAFAREQLEAFNEKAREIECEPIEIEEVVAAYTFPQLEGPTLDPTTASRFIEQLTRDIQSLFQYKDQSAADVPPLKLEHIAQIRNYINEQERRFQEVYDVEINVYEQFQDIEQLEAIWQKMHDLTSSREDIDAKIELLREIADNLPVKESPLWTKYHIIRDRMGLELTLSFAFTYFSDHLFIMPLSPEDQERKITIDEAFQTMATKLGCETPELPVIEMDTKNDSNMGEELVFTECGEYAQRIVASFNEEEIQFARVAMQGILDQVPQELKSTYAQNILVQLPEHIMAQLTPLVEVI